MSRIALTVLLAVSIVACREPAQPDPMFVADWLRTSLALANAERVAPPAAARVSAYASLALYEGYAADRRSTLRSLAGQLNGLWSVPLALRDRPVDGVTVAAEAERVVLDSLFSEGSARTKHAIDSVATAQIARRRSSGVGAETSTRSVDHGRALGRAILAWAATDGFLATRGRPWQAPKSFAQWTNTAAPDARVVQAGEPRTTLPRLSETQPTEPHWGTLRTFALRNGDECAPVRPPVYSEQRGSDFWKMGKELYDSASNQTHEKREIARFWADSPAPGFHWLTVVDQMIERRHLTADQAAEAYALTSVAMADAFIGAWKQKYRSMVMRPVTYVQRVFNSRWQAALTTPPFPDYPSGHSALAGAVVEVLVHLMGDTVAFADSSRMNIGVPARAFHGLTHARDEAAVSRIYAGLHFVPSVVQGLSQGQCVGQRVLGRLKTR